MKRVVSILLVLVMAFSCLGVVSAQEQTFIPVTDASEAVESEVPMYLCAQDGDGVRHLMRQTRGAAASTHGYAEKVTTTSPYSLYTTTKLDEAAPYCVVATECEGATEYLLQLHDAAGNKDYVLYIMTSGVGPNSLTGTTHAKHHFLWDAEKQYFYQLEGSVVYVLVMKNMKATYDATSTLPAMTQNEWRITCAPVSELETEGVYSVGLVYHSHSYTVPVQVGDAQNHRLDCACGSQGTELVAHSFGEDRTCVCGKRESVSLQEGIYYLTGKVNGVTYYFRKTVTGESVAHTAPYSLCATADKTAATLVDVIEESSGGYSLAYPYNDKTARIYVYDVGNNSTVDTGVNTANVAANHHFQWDEENAYFYQMEGDAKYVLSFKELKNTNTGKSEIRVQAVEESELQGTAVAVSPEAHTEHSCDTWIVDTPATTGSTGLKTGTCTVCGRQVQQVIPALTPDFCGNSISLKDNFAIHFHVEKAAFADGVYQNPYVVFEMAGKQTTVTAYTQEDEHYVFTFDDLSTDKINETVTATLYATKQDGTQVSATTQYSVAEYCYTALSLEQTGDALRRLLVDTLNFGAVSQRYRDSSIAEEDLANAKLTDEQRAWGTTDALRELTSCREITGSMEDSQIGWYAVSLVMQEAVRMRVYFRAEDTKDLVIKAVGASGGQWTLDEQDIKTKDGFFYIDFDALTPAQMGEKVSFAAYRGETAVSNTMHYSIESYAKVWLDREDTRQEQAALVDAIIRYGDAAKAYVERVYELQEDVRYLGRTYEQNGVQWFNWSASGFSVQFQGSGVKAKIVSNAPDAKNYAYLKVYVDGLEQEDILLDAKEQTVTLAEGLDPNKTHTVEVRKRNSPRSSAAGILSMELLDGKKLAPENAKDKLIEFIGDSLTVGYSAAEGSTAEPAWSTATEDATKTYSKQVADAFDADYMVTAISGRGVVMNNSGGSGYLFPEIYRELDIYNNPGVTYDFALQPDVIVINLGTNDATNSTLDMDVFKTGVTEYLTYVREKNPNAKIIWAYGLRTDTMTAEVAAAIQAAVSQLNTEGDSNVHYLPLAVATEMHLNHPTAAAYAPSGETLIEKIQEITGW